MNRNTKLGGVAALVIGAIVAWQNGTLDQFIGQQLGGGSAAVISDPSSAARQSSGEQRAARSQDGEFDYYVLAMSWSPSFCEDDTRGSAQCSGRRPYHFVAHGLWPQFERGYPENCSVSARVPERTVNEMLEIMPAKGLIFHQWKKHGTCSGMQPTAYFDTVEDAFRSVTIPEPFRGLDKAIVIKPSVIEDAFLEANPTLKPDMIAIDCKKKRLREVKVCFDKNLNFRACGKDVHRECRDNTIRMPPVRG